MPTVLTLDGADGAARVTAKLPTTKTSASAADRVRGAEIAGQLVKVPTSVIAGERDLFDAEVRVHDTTETGYDLTVTAHSLAKDVTVQADRLAGDAPVQSALVSLAAGESHTFDIATDAVVEEDRFVSFPVLCSANDPVSADDLVSAENLVSADDLESADDLAGR